MAGLIGKKIGMTSIFDAEGNNIPCTVISCGPCFVTQVKTEEKDGYVSIQLGFDDLSEKSVSKPLKGHFNKSGVSPKRKIFEFFFEDKDAYKLGSKLEVDIFEEGEYVDVTGMSKGKGFQGVVKRHGFGGVGESTHGQHNRLRAPGSIGAGSDPSRVFKGTRMAGRMGGEKVKIENLKVVKIDKDNNLLVVSGSVPGAKNSYLVITK